MGAILLRLGLQSLHTQTGCGYIKRAAIGLVAAIQVAAATPGIPRWLEWTANGVSWVFLVAATVALATDPSGRGLSFRVCRCGLADSREAAET